MNWTEKRTNQQTNCPGCSRLISELITCIWPEVLWRNHGWCCLSAAEQYFVCVCVFMCLLLQHIHSLWSGWIAPQFLTLIYNLMLIVWMGSKCVVKGNRVKVGGWFLIYGWEDAVNFPQWLSFIEAHCSVKAMHWGLFVTVTLQHGAASCSESPAWPEWGQQGHRLCPASTPHSRVLGYPGEAGFPSAPPSQALLL